MDAEGFDYIILASDTASTLRHLVIRYLRNGWRISGGVAYDSNRKEFLQAMVMGAP